LIVGSWLEGELELGLEVGGFVVGGSVGVAGEVAVDFTSNATGAVQPAKPRKSTPAAKTPRGKLK
jgi:hypothetical protein